MTHNDENDALVASLCREFCACLGVECDHQRARRFLTDYRVIPPAADPAADWRAAFPPIRPHTCHIELEALYAGQRDPDCAGCRCIPPGETS